ncbi:MAG: hypothetical protein ACLSH6_01640 [Limosilactobacillus pontis]
MKTRTQLKAEARSLLAGNWLTAIKLNIVQVVCQVITGVVITGVIAGLTYYLTKVSPTLPGDFTTSAGSNGSASGNSGQSFIGDLITTYLLLSVDFALIDWIRPRYRRDHHSRQPFKPSPASTSCRSSSSTLFSGSWSFFGRCC